MKKQTLSAGVAALAIALTMPFAFGQTASNSDTAASSPGDVAGAGMTYRQGQGSYGPGMMSGQGTGQGQGNYGPGIVSGQGTGQRQGNYGPGMMSGQSTGQLQPGYFASMMGGYGANSMGGYGWMWLPILLVLLAGGLVVWVVRRKAK